MEVNRVACRLLGYEKKELLGMNWSQLGVPDVLQEQNVFLKGVLKKKKITVRQ